MGADFAAGEGTRGRGWACRLSAWPRRLARLDEELGQYTRVARYLSLDLGRPVRSLADGYPENTITLTGKITERLLGQLWIHHGAPGTPAGW